MDAESFLKQMSSDLMYAGKDSLASEAMNRANSVRIERDYEDAMFNLYSNSLQQKYGFGPGGMMSGLVPPGGGVMAPAIPPNPYYPGPEPIFPRMYPDATIAQSVLQTDIPMSVPAVGEESELSTEEKERYEKELAELKQAEKKLERKLELLRVHRSRYVDYVQRNGYVVNVPYRFVPDAYYHEIGVPVWYPPGLMGNRSSASVWVSREPGTEVYRRMIQDSFDEKNTGPNPLQRLALSNRLYNSYGIVTTGCPPEDYLESDSRDFSVKSISGIGKTKRLQLQNFIVHFDIYRLLADAPDDSKAPGQNKHQSAASFDLNMIEVSVYHEPQPTDAISLLFIVDGSWLGSPKNRGADLARKLAGLGENLNAKSVKKIEKELQTRTWTNLSKFLVGLESLATAATVFSFTTEREYERAYAKAFTNRLDI